MQPQLTNLSLYMQPESITDEKARELRGHPAAREVGYGWLRIVPESDADRVLLVSTSAPVYVAFPYGAASLDQRRASLSANIYACRNPQEVCVAAFDVAERDQTADSTTS